MERITENIYTFPIRLPDNPLKWLNCYVIKGRPGQRSLLIDTGFRRRECLSDLLSGMEALSLVPEETDVFLTHVHSDHTGNAKDLQNRGCRLLMSEPDLDLLHQDHSASRHARMLMEGMPEDILKQVVEGNQGRRYAPEPFDARALKDGDILSCGGYSLTCLATPGHTPGHFCLYDRERELIFLGDHVLYDITPNISFWEGMDDALGTYLESLKKTADLPVKFALPGHRHVGSITLRERIDRLLSHHEARLAEAARIVRENPGIQAYELTGQMTWKIRSRNWAEFPPGQKWYAICEALAHLDHLVLTGRIERVADPNGSIRYRA